MPTGLTYNTLLTTLGSMMGGVNVATSPNVSQVLTSLIDYAEDRCYRDLDIQAARISDVSLNLTASSRAFTVASNNAGGRFVTVEQMIVFTPVGTLTTANPLLPVSRDTIYALWPSLTPTAPPSIPELYAPLTDQSFLVGPVPDAAYTVGVIGMARPPTLSNANQTTILSNYFPDLFLAACMIFAAGYQKNFGAQADDPKMSMSWEGTYQALLPAARLEENRKRFMGDAWTSQTTPSQAQPPRS